MSLLSDKHRYSYTQLSGFEECPFSFYLARIEKAEPVENAFSQQGTLIHALIDEWAKGKLAASELANEYEKRYADAVTMQWPRIMKGYAEKTFQQGLDYFTNFTGFIGYTVLESELKFTTEIDGRPFVGVIDMILKDDITDELIVLDHKSKSLASFKKNKREMYKQQYLYSKYVYEHFGRWPDILAFNLFKEGGVIESQPFDQTEYEETMQWAIDIIHRIEEFDVLDWLESKESPDFFCQNLCNMRNSCPNGR